jgi:hypothetical protein
MGPLIDLGPYPDLVRGQASGNGRMSIQLTVDPKLLPVPNITEGEGWKPFGGGANELDLTFAFDRSANRIVVHRSILRRDGRRLEEVVRRDRSYSSPSMPARYRQFLEPGLLKFLPYFRPTEEFPASQSRETADLLRRGANSQIQAHIWEHVFSSIDYVAPLRAPVPRFSILGDIPPAALSAGGEGLLSALRDEQPILGDKTLLDLVDRWMRQRFPRIQALRFVRVDRSGAVASLVADERGFKGVNVANMGAGLSQLLPVVAESFALPAENVLVVEQPEIHLHPAAQADLGDLFVERVRARGNRQVIIETHSEHLLLRVRRRVAEGRIRPEKVGVLFVERPGILPRIRLLDLDDSGHFDEWPDGFFDQGYEDALRLAMASSKRK